MWKNFNSKKILVVGVLSISILMQVAAFAAQNNQIARGGHGGGGHGGGRGGDWHGEGRHGYDRGYDRGYERGIDAGVGVDAGVIDAEVGGWGGAVIVEPDQTTDQDDYENQPGNQDNYENQQDENN